MNTSKQILLFFDIDGTILSEVSDEERKKNPQGPERYVPASAIKAIRLLQQNGHLCFINSGRSWSEITENITGLGFDGYVCGCGTYITYHDKILLADSIPQKLANQIYRDLHACRLEWLLEGQHDTYYSSLPYRTKLGGFFKEYSALFPDTSYVCPPEATDIPFDKFCICATEDSDLSTFMNQYEKDFCFIDRGGSFYEVVPAGHSKATGIKFLMDYFHVDHENTIAVGDSTNDLPMLEYAGTSIAMKVSDEPVLRIVDYVTDTVENDGIYKAMVHFHLIESIGHSH